MTLQTNLERLRFVEPPLGININACNGLCNRVHMYSPLQCAKFNIAVT